MNSIFERIAVWRTKRISEKNLILILNLIIGILAGWTAVILINAIHITNYFLESQMEMGVESYLYLARPGIGIIITVLCVHCLVKDKTVHGVSKFLYSISKKNGIIKPHNTFSSIVASTFTIGFGGSVGAEAPITHTGTGIGSNLHDCSC